MSANSTSMRLASGLVLAALAAALGGCAGSVAQVPASTSVSALSYDPAYVPAPAQTNEFNATPKAPKAEAAAVVRTDVRQASAASAPIVAHRRGDCGL
jgi:hypothetical protein